MLRKFNFVEVYLLCGAMVEGKYMGQVNGILDRGVSAEGTRYIVINKSTGNKKKLQGTLLLKTKKNWYVGDRPREWDIEEEFDTQELLEWFATAQHEQDLLIKKAKSAAKTAATKSTPKKTTTKKATPKKPAVKKPESESTAKA